jgi:hypothetical protein
MSRESYGATVQGWKTLGGGLEVNAGDNRNLEEHRLVLADLAEKADALLAQRNALEAEKQAVTRELQTILEEGRRVASLLRAGMKLRYGNRSEKLVEFGVRPFHRRSRKPADGEPSP